MVLATWARRLLRSPSQPKGAVFSSRPASMGVWRGPSGVDQVKPSSRPSGWQLAQARPSTEIVLVAGGVEELAPRQPDGIPARPPAAAGRSA